MLGNGVCDQPCLNAACDNDRGDCEAELCNPGCFPYLIWDNVCQEECYVAACNWDYDDCDCSPGCTLELLSNKVCDLECSFIDCSFDQHYCGDCATGCFHDMIGNGVCDEACNVEDCYWDRMDCGCAPGCAFGDMSTCTAECLVPECQYGPEECLSSIDSITCDDVVCDSGRCTYQVECCGGFVEVLFDCFGACAGLGYVTSAQHPSVCVGQVDFSSASSPKVLYVSPTSSGAEEDGSLEKPYSSLSAASRHLRSLYVDIILLAGVHSLEGGGRLVLVSMKYLFSVSTFFMFTRVSIDSFACRYTSECTPVTIRRSNEAGEAVFFLEYAALTVANVVFQADVRGSCPLCGDGSELFRLVSGRLGLYNVTFQHFDQVVNFLIQASYSEIELSNVNFTALTLDSSLFEKMGIIYSSNFVKLKYSTGTVALLNSIYDYTSYMITGGFLCLNSAQLLIENVIFEYNLVDSGMNGAAPTCQSLMGIQLCIECEIRNSLFRNNLGYYGTVLQHTPSNWLYLKAPERQKMLNSTFLMLNCTFQNNTSSGGTLIFAFTGETQAVTLHNCSFLDELSTGSGVISVNSTRTEGTAVFELSDVRFLRVRVGRGSVIAAFTFPNFLLSHLTISDSGSAQGETMHSTSLEAFKSIPGARVPVYPTITQTYSCASLVNLTKCGNATFSDVNLESWRCNAAFFASESEVRMTKVQLLATAAANGTALSIISAVTVDLREVSVRSNNNEGLGSVYLEAIEVTLSNCTFQGNRAFKGGALYVASFLHVYMTNCSFQGNRATYGAAVSMEIPAGGLPSLVIELSRFEGNIATTSSGVLELTTQEASSSLHFSVSSTLFRYNIGPQSSVLFWPEHIQIGPGSNIRESKFAFNTAAQGGVLYFDRTSGSITIADSEFSHNSGEKGTALFFRCLVGSKCVLDVRNTTFSANSGKSMLDVTDSTVLQAAEAVFRENSGTCVSMESAEVVCAGCAFAGNTATYGAAVHLVSASGSFFRSHFEFNRVEYAGGAFAVESNSGLVCQSCVFRNNSSGWQGGAVSVEQRSTITVRACRFTGNKALNSGFSLYFFMNTEFSLVTDSEFEGNEGGGYGCIFLLSALLSMRNSSVSNNWSQKLMGGLVLHLSQAEVSDSLFRNQTGIMGPFVYSYHSTALLTRCDFAHGAASTSGGALIAITSALTIVSSSFTRLTSPLGGVMHLQSGSSVRVEQCVLTGLEASENLRGVISVDSSALSMDSSQLSNYSESGVFASESNLTVTRSIFANATAALGTGIHCSPCFALEVVSSRFEHLKADSAAALYLSGSRQAQKWLISDSTFTKNKGLESGAVVLEDASADFTSNLFEANEASGPVGCGGALTLLSPLSLRLLNNTFSRNTAVHSGGAVFWTGSEPLLAATAFEENAAFYGPNLASYAVRLKLESALHLSEVASGHRGEQLISLLLLDHYGQRVASDSSSFAQLTSANQNTTFAGLFRVQANEGRYTFADFAVVSPPGERTSVTVNSTGIADSTYSSLELQVGMRLCQAGESLVSGMCFVCEVGTYSLDPAGGCKECPSEAVCYGNLTIVPKQGYWRPDRFTERFFECPNPTACLGSPTGTNMTGECAEGYEGNMCQSCHTEYSKWQGAYCSRCSILRDQVLLQVFLTLVTLVLLLLVVASFLSGSVYSLRVKVFIDYVQLVMLLSTINLSWPHLMLHLFHAQGALGAFPEFLLSLHCFFVGETDEDNYYRQLVLVSASPPALILFSTCTWLVVATKKSLKGVFNRMVCSAIVLFFLAYPSALRVAVGAFRCEEIAAGEFWIAGVEVRCWTATHSKFAFGLALPCALLVGVFAPMSLFLLLWRHKNQGTSANARFAFLLQSYSDSQRFWEFVVIGRKLLVICIVAFASQVAPSFQAVGVLAVLLTSLALLHRYRPFLEFSQYALDVRSHLVVIVTVYIGLLFYSNLLDSGGSAALFAFAVVMNTYFTVLCFSSLVRVACRFLGQKIMAFRKRPVKDRYQPTQVDQLDQFGNRFNTNRVPAIMLQANSLRL